MSMPTQESSYPLVCAVDRDRDLLPVYRGVVEGQGLRLRFFASISELQEEVSLNRIMALLLDVEADPGNSISLQRDLLKEDVPPSVILTTDDRRCDEVIESLALGAIALLPRPWIPELMSQYLKHAQIQYQEWQKLSGKLSVLRQVLDGLTERQREVLELAATGLSNKLIAMRIDVSQRTVESERSRLLEAFGANSVADAMIRFGEYRALEQVERIRRRAVRQRLGVQAATTMEEPWNAGIH